jgi:hypothetical protein
MLHQAKKVQVTKGLDKDNARRRILANFGLRGAFAFRFSKVVFQAKLPDSSAGSRMNRKNDRPFMAQFFDTLDGR